MQINPLLRKILYIFFILIIIIYTIFKLYNLISGPKIEIFYPDNFGKVDAVFTISGRIQRADKIYLFDREILTDEKGYFKETMIANDAWTDIIIKATNRFGKENQIKLTVENVNNK